MSIKCVIKFFGALIFLSFIFLNGCDVDSPTVIHANVPSVSAKIAKAKHHQHYQHSASADLEQWLPNDPQITVSSGNFWDRLRGSFQLNHYCDNPKVKAQINWFCHHQGYLNRSVKRASPYMYYIFEQVQKRNLPGELLLLPFIESAFNPFAYSGPGAAGLWQIMPQTGTGFGLKQNWWYDGRRDVHASTNAALDYLTYLQSYFDGDWLLATAAYNTGEGTVQQAIRRNARMGRDTDFFSLGLSQETQSYVPRLLALATIISNPEDYPITLPPVRDEPYLAEVSVGCQIDLTEAAQLAGISQEEMRRLNPAYRHKLTRPHSGCRLLLPISQVETFKANLKQLSVVNHVSLQRYKVRRGETIDSIASHFQVSSLKLRNINHLKSRCVRPGRTIFVPVESPMMTGNAKPTELAVEKTEEKTSEESQQISQISGRGAGGEGVSVPGAVEEHANSLCKMTHRIKKGDTLQKLAGQYHVEVKDLRRWNHLAKHATLRPGRVVVILQKQEQESVTVKQEPVTVKTVSHVKVEKTVKMDTHKKISAKSIKSSQGIGKYSKVSKRKTVTVSVKKHHVRTRLATKGHHRRHHAPH